MPHSSLADGPSLTRSHTANSTVRDEVSRGPSQVRLSRRTIKSKASIDAMFVDVENRPGTAPNLESRDTRLEMGAVHDLHSGFDLPPILKIGYGKVQKKSNRRAESLAARLGDQILDADLKSLSYPTLELPDKKFRQESQIKRVAFLDQKVQEPVLELVKDDAETPLLSTSQLSPPSLKRGEKGVMPEAPDKAGIKINLYVYTRYILNSFCA